MEKIDVLKILLDELKIAGFNHLYKEDGKLSKTAVQKLLFFVCLIEKHLKGEKSKLFTIFNNFHALTYGHVESDVLSHWDEIQESNTTSTQIDEFKSYLKDLVKEINTYYPFLQNLDVTGLINFSHLMPSWRIAFSNAIKKQKIAEPINSELFNEDVKIIK